MLRVRPLLENDSRRCGECGRAWWELCGYHGCPERQWVELRGAIGADNVRVMLCPECSDELLEVLWQGFGLSLGTLHENQEAERDKLPIPETPDVPSLIAFARAKSETA